MAMSEDEILAIVRIVLLWTGAGVCAVLSGWTLVETIVEIARRKSRPYERDVVVSVLFLGGMAFIALNLANWALNGA